MAQIEFFATVADERELFTHLAKDKSLMICTVIGDRLTDWVSLDAVELPPYEEELILNIWKSDIGEINFYSKIPSLDESSHSKLVQSVLAIVDWKRVKKEREVSKMLDLECSPLITYKRGNLKEGYRIPSYIVSPQSSINVFGDEFRKWFNRTLSWVRRNGEMVFHWKMSKDEIVFRNDLSYSNTIYALPEALAQIKAGEHPFAISVRRTANK
ncbi:hypothetical protein JAO76_07890 [Pontibacter sp. BT310]|uniref:Uncharacterized protein n=1 Tax=Pontibacter populi TaxID=890055 RepID=A0ABS6XBC5_9BACT|nr:MULTISPECIES: hypothetical protein [Pontibacter]MBJ6118106.1 hypothetical protein [Pontibacter sp. BT310]MBR0570533.1 hypothetical protein [Microvirga sp. STS03]MBW3364959.1 hypothetical protein [Pontibacter populi]